jgi:hypothetical protein
MQLLLLYRQLLLLLDMPLLLLLTHKSHLTQLGGSARR